MKEVLFFLLPLRKRSQRSEERKKESLWWGCKISELQSAQLLLKNECCQSSILHLQLWKLLSPHTPSLKSVTHAHSVSVSGLQKIKGKSQVLFGCCGMEQDQGSSC